MICTLIAGFVLAARAAPPQDSTTADLAGAARVAGVEFDAAELDQMQRAVNDALRGFRAARAIDVPHEVAPAFVFQALLPGMRSAPPRVALTPLEFAAAKRPEDLTSLHFADVPTLAALVRSRAVSCRELVEVFLARLEDLDPKLRCVVTLLPERARESARVLDAELERGQWRGPLHGIPWGAKDILAVRGAPTTWGSPLYESRVIDADAAVVEKLDAAGAILVAKLSVGELAYGDLWFGGRTRNPWKLDEGSSGSSAGSASAVAAGALPFAIGSETLGSIVSPSTVCGATGLRPTFGRVSRHGAMTVAWTMDKVGPLARSALDAALVLDAIEGEDERDASSRDAAFDVGRPARLGTLRVGYERSAFERVKSHAHVLDELRGLGLELVPVEWPASLPSSIVWTILASEVAEVFDPLVRDGSDARMCWQADEAWPNTFRSAHLIPAVEYLRAMRLRTTLQLEVAKLFESVDVVVHPSRESAGLVLTNLTGHPAIAMPDGFDARGRPRGITFTGALFGESDLVALAVAWQESTRYHRVHPPL